MQQLVNVLHGHGSPSNASELTGESEIDDTVRHGRKQETRRESTMNDGKIRHGRSVADRVTGHRRLITMLKLSQLLLHLKRIAKSDLLNQGQHIMLECFPRPIAT